MTDTEAKLQEMKLILLNNLKKKVEKIEDKTDEKEGKIADPLKNMKAIVKHYGTHNRLKQYAGRFSFYQNILSRFKSGNGIIPNDTEKVLKRLQMASVLIFEMEAGAGMV